MAVYDITSFCNSFSCRFYTPVSLPRWRVNFPPGWPRLKWKFSKLTGVTPVMQKLTGVTPVMQKLTRVWTAYNLLNFMIVDEEKSFLWLGLLGRKLKSRNIDRSPMNMPLIMIPHNILRTFYLKHFPWKWGVLILWYMFYGLKNRFCVSAF